MERKPSGTLDGWPDGQLDDLPGGQWMVVHAKPRQEKCLATHLRHVGNACLLFLERRVRHYPGKGNQTSLVPLIPGYIFVPGGEQVRDLLYASGRVVRIIDVHHGEGLRQDLIDLTRLVTRVDVPLIVRPELQPGTRVELTRGSLCGMSGVVVRRKGRCELVVNVHMLGTSVAVACSALDINVV